MFGPTFSGLRGLAGLGASPLDEQPAYGSNLAGAPAPEQKKPKKSSSAAGMRSRPLSAEDYGYDEQYHAKNPEAAGHASIDELARGSKLERVLDAIGVFSGLMTGDRSMVEAVERNKQNRRKRAEGEVARDMLAHIGAERLREDQVKEKAKQEESYGKAVAAAMDDARTMLANPDLTLPKGVGYDDVVQAHLKARLEHDFSHLDRLQQGGMQFDRAGRMERERSAENESLVERERMLRPGRIATAAGEAAASTTARLRAQQAEGVGPDDKPLRSPAVKRLLDATEKRSSSVTKGEAWEPEGARREWAPPSEAAQGETAKEAERAARGFLAERRQGKGSMTRRGVGEDAGVVLELLPPDKREPFIKELWGLAEKEGLKKTPLWLEALAAEYLGGQ